MFKEIKNLPDYAKDYKFVVARRDASGALWFWGAWNERNTANCVALNIGGEVVEKD